MRSVVHRRLFRWRRLEYIGIFQATDCCLQESGRNESTRCSAKSGSQTCIAEMEKLVRRIGLRREEACYFRRAFT